MTFSRQPTLIFMIINTILPQNLVLGFPKSGLPFLNMTGDIRNFGQVSILLKGLQGKMKGGVS